AAMAAAGGSMRYAPSEKPRPSVSAGRSGARAGGQAVDSGAVHSSGLGHSVTSRRGSSSNMGVHDETRMMTGTSPLARARMRAQGVVGRLKRLLMDKAGGDFDATQLMEPSPHLQQAIQRLAPVVRNDAGLGS